MDVVGLWLSWTYRIGGISLALALKQRGIHDFVVSMPWPSRSVCQNLVLKTIQIYERENDVGGEYHLPRSPSFRLMTLGQ